MTDLVLETPEGVPLRFELAGAGARILAAAIDGVLFVLGVLIALLAMAVGGLDFGVMLLTSGLVLLLVAYSFLFPLFLDGCTPGKLWTGIRVRDAQGFAPRATQLFLRALFVPLEAFLVVPVPLVWILIAATPRHQRLGDMVASTVVLRARHRRAPPEPVRGLFWSKLDKHAFALDPAAVRALTGRDLGLLRDLLTRTELDEHARGALYARAAAHYGARLGLPERRLAFEDARTFLRELFLLLREVRAGGPVTVLPAAAAGAADRGGPRASGSLPR